MGEIADLMLDGTLCAQCGVYLGQEYGMPMYCSACRPPVMSQSPRRRRRAKKLRTRQLRAEKAKRERIA